MCVKIKLSLAEPQWSKHSHRVYKDTSCQGGWKIFHGGVPLSPSSLPGRMDEIWLPVHATAWHLACQTADGFQLQPPHSMCKEATFPERGVCSIEPNPSGFQGITQYHRFISSLPLFLQESDFQSSQGQQFRFFIAVVNCNLNFVSWTTRNIALGLAVTCSRCCTCLSELTAIFQPVEMPQKTACAMWTYPSQL